MDGVYVYEGQVVFGHFCVVRLFCRPFYTGFIRNTIYTYAGIRYKCIVKCAFRELKK